MSISYPHKAFAFLFFLASFSVTAQPGVSEPKHRLVIDLVNIEDNKVAITLYPPAFDTDTAVYNMPTIIPGTYSISDFGRFTEDFHAISRKGDTLNVVRLDTNRRAVAGARDLDFIRYKVSGTFDAPMSGGIFEPGGTNISAGENVLLNMFGFAGYFDGTKHSPFEVEVLRPADWYGATSLTRLDAQDSTDFFTASDYFELHDCPILYAVPDTASMQAANARVEVAVYSPTGMVSAVEVMAEVEDIFNAAAVYLGGTLPVDRYSILLYLSGGGSFSRGYGALEHNTSTVFVLPESPVATLSQTIKDVTAHEFFHIVTPLNIHSEHIHDYDFVNPQMSKHLWLYEGCTEYAAQHVQVKQGLFDIEKFLSVMRGKMLTAARYDTSVPFTELSSKALDEHKDQYGNVYQQGALIGMALDLKLRKLSGGNYGIQDLMHDLSEEYGSERPFKDDSLFAEIARLSGFPETEDFLNRHVAGTEPLPYAELMAPFGVLYADSLKQTEISAGSIRMGYNPRREAMVVASTASLDEFGKTLNLNVGDEIAAWDGEEVTLENFEKVIKEFKKRTEPGDKFKVKINRKAKDYKTETVKVRAIETERTRKRVLEPMDDPTPEQVALRKTWLGQ
ncbi:MAG: peptidase M61 [Flavobacteriales bacterium]|nr:peptidase M61 [Flavobacteriales bacterium]